MGLLTQALANVGTVEKQIGALSGLPPAARTIQSQAAAIIARAVPEIQKLQSDVGAFTTRASSQLADALGSISRNDPLATIKARMQQVQTDALALQTNVNAVAQDISGSSQQVFDFATPLSTVVSQLQQQQSVLQGQVNSARDEENAYHKRYLYLLALGPFGLVGLATALGLYFKFKSEADDCARQASALSAQISGLQSMVNACDQLSRDFTDLSNKIQAVRNSVGFLAGDISTILSDASQNGPTPALLQVYVMTAQTEVTTLRADAS